MMMARLTSPIMHGRIPAGSVGEAISFSDRLELDIDGEIYLIPYAYIEIIDNENCNANTAGDTTSDDLPRIEIADHSKHR